jgi:hypothetical protein
MYPSRPSSNAQSIESMRKNVGLDYGMPCFPTPLMFGREHEISEDGLPVMCSGCGPRRGTCAAGDWVVVANGTRMMMRGPELTAMRKMPPATAPVGGTGFHRRSKGCADRRLRRPGYGADANWALRWNLDLRCAAREPAASHQPRRTRRPRFPLMGSPRQRPMRSWPRARCSHSVRAGAAVGPCRVGELGKESHNPGDT